MCKYPNVTVELIGHDGNAFAIVGKVMQALRRADVPKAEIDAYYKEAMAGDYDHLLRTTMDLVEVE